MNLVEMILPASSDNSLAEIYIFKVALTKLEPKKSRYMFDGNRKCQYNYNHFLNQT